LRCVPPDRIRGRYSKSLANIPQLLALCEVFTLVDDTDTPTIIFEKNASETKIRPNRRWATEAIAKLIWPNKKPRPRL
jgi:predicted ABC-type ATPase